MKILEATANAVRHTGRILTNPYASRANLSFRRLGALQQCRTPLLSGRRPRASRVQLIRLFQLLLCGCALLGPLGASVQAESITLAWNPSPDSTVIGYYLHYGTRSGVYTQRIDSGDATLISVNGLEAGQTYYFAVTAYNDRRVESLPSGEITYTVPQLAPLPGVGQIRILSGATGQSAPRLEVQVPLAHRYDIYASSDLKRWERIHWTVSLSANWLEFVDHDAGQHPKRFYKLAVPDTPPVPGILAIQQGGYPPGSRRLTPHVTEGEHYEIQFSDDLREWATLHEGFCTAAGSMDVIDPMANASPNRYYRLRLADGTFRSLAAHLVQSGTRIRVTALAGRRYRVECSEDFETWDTIHEAMSGSRTPIELVDPATATVPQRFYRLVFE